MKFNDGRWEIKKGVKVTNFAQVRDIKIENDRVKIFGVNYQHDERSLGGPVISLEITSPNKNIISVKAIHFSGSNQIEPKFELNQDNSYFNAEYTDEGVVIHSDETSLVITKKPASFTYYYKDKCLTSISTNFGSSMLSTILYNEKPFMRVQLGVDIAENIYGLGERFTPFVKNGQVVDIWNEDGGTASEISYKNIPFYITNKAYGVFVNSSDKVSFELCSEAVTSVQFSVPGQELEFMVVGGEDMKDVLSNYTELTGKPALPPAWSFGLWLTSSFTTSYDHDTVMSFVEGMQKRNIPLHVFHFDCFWMKENHWCDFIWDKDVFPNVEQTLKAINDKNIKICVWINPYIAQLSYLFDEGKKLGYFLKTKNGDVYQDDRWQCGMAYVDFTNPDAYKWYQDKLRVLLNQGVSSFKTDFGERIPDDAVYFDGSNAVKMHNYYTYLYNKCVFELLEEFYGKDEACVFARSATVGGQKFPVHWGGDCSSTFMSMSETLRGGLSLCMSGFSFWSHDISGFEGTAPDEVYKRWVAFGLLSSHSRLHGAKSYRVPWLFGEEAVDVTRLFTNLKCQLMPYIFSLAVNSHKTGIPLMRAMVLEFENDPACRDLSLQYMLGDNLLVAPVFKESGDVEYYLPKGVWTNILTNERVSSGWQNENHNFMSLPLMAKENSIIAFGKDNKNVDYDYEKGVIFHAFEIKDKAFSKVYNTKGVEQISLSILRKADMVEAEFTGTGEDVKILLRNVSEIKNLANAVQEKCDLGVLIKVIDLSKKVTFDY